MPKRNSSYQTRIQNSFWDAVGKEWIPSTVTVNTNGRTLWNGNQRRRVAGFVPPTSCNSVIMKYNNATYEDGDGVITRRRGSVTYVYRTDQLVRKGKRPSESDQAAAKLRSRARFIAHAGLAETLIESPDSLRMIARRTGSLISILAKAGRGNFAGAAFALKEATGYNVSNRKIKRMKQQFGQAKAYDSRRASAFWLETQFGFLPIFQSIFDSMEAYSKSKRVHRARANSNGASHGWTAEVVNQRRYLLHQLGLTNPAALVWDLLPFSFVVDWFAPIGLSLRWIGSNMGTSRVWEWSATTSVNTTTLKNSGHFVSSQTVYTRTVNPRVSRFPDDIWSASPRSLGLWHAVTAVSLVDSLR